MIETKDKVRCLSRYALLRQLAQGNLTRTFLAARKNPGPARLAVLELLQEDLAKDDDFRALFLDRAARTLALAHPQLARTEEVVADARSCGVSLEFLDGQPLARVLGRLGRQRFPVDVHLHVLRQVLVGLEHAHDAAGSGAHHVGFVHGNVCPYNVFITYDGRVKLLGTGFADATHVLSARLARPLVDIHYAAPEVLLGARAQPSADLFSVGVMLWEAVMQRARLTSVDPLTVIDKRTGGNEPDLEKAWPDAPEPLLELCGRALARDPQARQASARQLRIALDAYLARATQPSETVLGRLPALLQSVFASEREEMQLFIGTSLDSLEERAVDTQEHSLPAALGLASDDGWELHEEETPHDEEWSAETPNVLPDDARVALRNSVEPQAVADLGADAPAEADVPAGRRLAAALAAAPSSSPAAPPSAPVAERRDSDTGGHRAYSATLPSTAAPFTREPERKTGTIAVALLLAVAVGAGAAVIRHSASHAPHGDPTPPAARANPTDSPIPPTRAPSSDPVAAEVPAQPLADAGAGDAGAPVPEPAPAFFDGRSSAFRREGTLRTLSLDDLPAVDDARDGLQQAVLNAARARRFALRRKHLPKPAPKPESDTWSEAGLQRVIDETDPYADRIEP